MRNKWAINAVVILGIGAFFGSAFIRTHNLTHPDFGDVGKAVSAVGTIVGLYEGLLWRWLPLPGRSPRLLGTWKMLLTPQDGPDGLEMDERDCYMSVRQTASSINAKLLFADAKSDVTTATFAGDKLGEKLLLFYEYKPDNPTTANPRREGAMSLDISPGKLNGKYWNDVGIRGRLKSKGRTRRSHQSYDDAVSKSYS